MTFRESLEKIVLGTEGGVAGVVMAMDGMPVESYVRDGSDVDISLYGAEVASLLGRFRGPNAGHLSSGLVEGVDLFCEKYHALVRFLSDEYFVVVAIEPGGNVGKGRYLMRTTVPELVEQL